MSNCAFSLLVRKQMCPCLWSNERAPGCSCSCWSYWTNCGRALPWRWRARCASLHWQHLPFYPGQSVPRVSYKWVVLSRPCCGNIVLRFILVACLITTYHLLLTNRLTQKCLLCLVVSHLLSVTNQPWPRILEAFKSVSQPQRKVLSLQFKLSMCLLMTWQILLLLPHLLTWMPQLCCHDRCNQFYFLDGFICYILLYLILLLLTDLWAWYLSCCRSIGLYISNAFSSYFGRGSL